ncbi:unnamed protein product, partial [Symbiodinium microadriaticum]
ARKLRFAAVMTTHCLAGDVSWMKHACSEVWILSGGRLRKHRPSRPDGYEELRRYAALRSRMGNVNV